MDHREPSHAMKYYFANKMALSIRTYKRPTRGSDVTSLKGTFTPSQHPSKKNTATDNAFLS